MARATEFHRVLDRYLGIPIAGVIGAVTRRRPIPAHPRRIGIIQTTAIGDTILSSGVIAHLRATYPDAELHLFHGASNAPALPLLATEVVGHRCDFRRPFETAKRIRACGLDILIDATPWSRIAALVTRFSGSRATVGFRTAGQFRGQLYGATAEHSNAGHEADNLLGLANLFAPLATYAMALRQDFPAPRLALAYDRLVLLHASPGGSRAKAKTWPNENWAALARRLCDGGFLLGFTGAAADRPAVSRILARIDRPPGQVFSLAGTMDLAELGHVLQRCRLLITVDTAVLHLAAALDTPMVALHGPTASRRWGAQSLRAISINARHPAAGHINFGYERHPRQFEIMARITVDEVFHAAMALLEEGRTRAVEPAFPG